MKAHNIVSRYAKALYDLAVEEKIEAQMLAELEQIVGMVEENEELRASIASPLYDDALKKKILAAVVSQSQGSAYLTNFLNILIEKDRFEYLNDIFLTFRDLVNEASGKVKASVISAVDLDAAAQQKIAAALSKKVNKEVGLEVSVDPAIVGGIIAEVEGVVYDGSVRTQLVKIKQGLKGEI